MSETYDKYLAKLELYTAELQSMEELRKEEKMADLVFQVLSKITKDPVDNLTPAVILNMGSRVLGAGGYLNTKTTFKEGESKMAGISYKHVWIKCLSFTKTMKYQ